MSKKSEIKDKTFLFTGTLTEFSYFEVKTLLDLHHGIMLSEVSAKLNYLVVGEDAGSELEKAKALGSVKILTQKEFWYLFELIYVEKNEISLDLKISDLKTLMSKYVTNTITDKILTISESIQSFDDITSDDKSFFYYSEANGKLIMNYFLEEVENEINLNEDIFKDLAKYSKSDFKMVFLENKFWELSFCVYTNGETKYEKSIINDFRHNLVYGDEYLNFAPDWYEEF
jgi:hypothetical protein